MDLKKRFGEVLVEAGVITEAQLRAALEKQRSTGLMLGRILVQEGYITDIDVAQALAEQLELPFFPPGELRPHHRLTRHIGEETARRYKAVPVKEDDQGVLVAMVDPLNVFALDDLSFITGKKCRPAVTTEQALEKALAEVFEAGGVSAAAVPTEDSSSGGYTLGGAEGTPAVKLVDRMIRDAIDERASDIHIEPMQDRMRVRYRIDGVLHDVMSQSLEMHAPCVSRIKIMASMDISERRVPQDGRAEVRYKGRTIDLRISTLPTIFGEKVAIRLLDKSQALTELEELGFEADVLEIYKEMIRRPHGMLLVTGPTGSGKTTTLMATLRRLNRPEVNIITLEDPVEYDIPGVNQVQVNPRAGLTFANGLRSIVRQDPNIIMVGEIRDRETADIAVRSALTGHLVLSSLHTNDSAGTVTRLLDMGVEPALLASCLLGCLAQRLVRVLCPRCKEEYELGETSGERFGLPFPAGLLRLYRPVGCAHCNHTGYRGRTGIFELLPVTAEIRQLIIERASAEHIAGEARAQGMRSVAEAGVKKVLAGQTSIEELRRVAFEEGA